MTTISEEAQSQRRSRAARLPKRTRPAHHASVKSVRWWVSSHAGMCGTTRRARRRSKGDSSDELDFVASACCSLCISKTPSPKVRERTCTNAKLKPRERLGDRPRRRPRKTAPLGPRRLGRHAGKQFQLAGSFPKRNAQASPIIRALSRVLRPERERPAAGAARGDDAPALPVYLDARQALGGVNEYSFDLLRRQSGVGFEHAGDGRGDDGRGERGAVNELVVLADDIVLVELDGDELAQEVRGQVARVREVAVNAPVLLDEGPQLLVGRAVEARVEFGLGGGGRVRQDGRGNPYAGRDDFGLLQTVEGRAVGGAVETAARGVERVVVVEAADGD